MYDVILPDAGEGTVESEIIVWFFKVGDEVKEDDILLEMQSDKAVVELPSPVSGVLKEIHYDEGEMAQVGKPVASIEIEGDNESSTDVEEDTVKETTEDANNVENKPTMDNQVEEEIVATMENWRSLAVPRVRIYARNNNVDITEITGTGKRGKVTIEDIDSYLQDPEAKKATVETEEFTSTSEVSESSESVAISLPKSDVKPYKPGQDEESETADRVEKISGMRRATANAMLNSKLTSPHVTVFDQVEVSALVDHRSEMKEVAANKEIHLTYTAYFVKALVAMLKRFPALNASMNLEENEIYYHQYHNIGVAVNTPQGLLVPNIKHADRLSLFEIAQKVTELSEKANAGKIASSDMEHGSMTITNVGGAATGGVWSTPIINQPEIAIVGMGRIEEQFLPDEEGNPVLKPVLKISFAFDHRVVDGVYVQEAINQLKEYLHNPNLLLAEG